MLYRNTIADNHRHDVIKEPGPLDLSEQEKGELRGYRPFFSNELFPGS